MVSKILTERTSPPPSPARRLVQKISSPIEERRRDDRFADWIEQHNTANLRGSPPSGEGVRLRRGANSSSCDHRSQHTSPPTTSAPTRHVRCALRARTSANNRV